MRRPITFISVFYKRDARVSAMFAVSILGRRKSLKAETLVQVDEALQFKDILIEALACEDGEAVPVDLQTRILAAPSKVRVCSAQDHQWKSVGMSMSPAIVREAGFAFNCIEFKLDIDETPTPVASNAFQLLMRPAAAPNARGQSDERDDVMTDTTPDGADLFYPTHQNSRGVKLAICTLWAAHSPFTFFLSTPS